MVAITRRYAVVFVALALGVSACGGSSGPSGEAGKGCAELKQAIKALGQSADSDAGTVGNIDSADAHSRKAHAHFLAAGGKWADKSNWKAESNNQAKVNTWCGL
jgi:hypothetical protein